MSKPSNWYSMDYTERKEWENNQRAIENAEYDARRAQDEAEQTRRDFEQRASQQRKEMRSIEEDYRYMIYDLNERIAELEAALVKINGEFYSCQHCDETGIEPETKNDACERCGGYGFNPSGDIRQAIVDARALLKGGAS